MSGASMVSYLLSLKSEINALTRQSIEINDRYEFIEKRYSKEQTRSDKWYEAYDKMFNGGDDGNGVKFNNETYYGGNATIATAYANAKVKNFDPDLLDELEELDLQYDTMKTAIEAELEEKQAQYDAAKESTSTELSNTYILGSGG